jgi:hypothetical protein
MVAVAWLTGKMTERLLIIHTQNREVLTDLSDIDMRWPRSDPDDLLGNVVTGD